MFQIRYPTSIYFSLYNIIKPKNLRFVLKCHNQPPNGLMVGLYLHQVFLLKLIQVKASYLLFWINMKNSLCISKEHTKNIVKIKP